MQDLKGTIYLISTVLPFFSKQETALVNEGYKKVASENTV